MRRRIHRILRFLAVVLVAGASAAPAATAGGERAGDPGACAAWTSVMRGALMLYGIDAPQAAEYLPARLDSPCHRPVTPRSLFHAGDPA
jgi:hypothetical protein